MKDFTRHGCHNCPGLGQRRAMGCDNYAAQEYWTLREAQEGMPLENALALVREERERRRAAALLGMARRRAKQEAQFHEVFSLLVGQNLMHDHTPPAQIPEPTLVEVLIEQTMQARA